MRDDEITPARVISEGSRWLPVVLWAIAIVTAFVLVICAVGFFVGGWFRSAAISRNYGQDVNAKGYQVALRDQMVRHWGNVTDLAVTAGTVPADSPEQVNIRAQQLAEIGDICAEATQLNGAVPLSPDVAKVVTQNCTAGAVSPASPYRK